ncbi:GNAT family N-acetyltransferase [Streptomyces malaysiense]|uniref:GNAT family N-acetyltransferase n=1 Tax=Streptomyces malaysiense TaxID=1428626 RepID=A0A1J4Q4J6_9ACTN|nr:GNAT family N-acetyltransferase [Streptomyces malaysiense]OIK27954.1 GNAT family N-acetyltransferase [Streptomyces malaysiense]
MDIRVEVVREPSRELADAFGRLLPQLSGAAAPLDRAAVDRLVAHDANTVLVARTPEAIVGTLVLVLLPLPSGLRGRIEDVVVDGAARGRGVAGLLIEEAVRLARKAGVRTLDLTSRPDRASANRLYERIGFRPRESTVFRLDE